MNSYSKKAIDSDFNFSSSFNSYYYIGEADIIS